MNPVPAPTVPPALASLALAALLNFGVPAASFAADPAVTGAGNAAALRTAERSPLVRSALRFLVAQAGRIGDKSLRDASLDFLTNPQACALHRRGLATAAAQDADVVVRSLGHEREQRDGQRIRLVAARAAGRPQSHPPTRFRMAQQLLAEGIVGPAGAESGLQPFSWENTTAALRNVSHVGEAEDFAFHFEVLKPSSLFDDAGLPPAMPLSSR